MTENLSSFLQMLSSIFSYLSIQMPWAASSLSLLYLDEKRRASLEIFISISPSGFSPCQKYLLISAGETFSIPIIPVASSKISCAVLFDVKNVGVSSFVSSFLLSLAFFFSLTISANDFLSGSSLPLAFPFGSLCLSDSGYTWMECQGIVPASLGLSLSLLFSPLSLSFLVVGLLLISLIMFSNSSCFVFILAISFLSVVTSFL